MEKGTLVNCSKAVNEYINREDWRISANANTGYSSAGLVNNLAGKMIANWWLDEVYSKEEGEAHRNGDYHIHDLDILGAYCCGHDLQKLLQEGFNGVISRVGAKPPKHFREALYQMANYLGILQAEWAGAQAFSSFDTLLAPYVFYDMYIHGVSETDIKKAIVNFIYNLNVPSRWGQSPFSNLTIDWTVPTSLKDLVPMRGDKPYFVGIYEHGLKEKVNNHKETCIGESKYLKFIDELRKRLNDYESDEEMLMYSITYGIFQPEMDIINRCFYQVLNEGDKDGQPFTFPIPTVNITEDFDWDNPNCYYLFENAAKYGSSYFQNFIGSQYLRDENGKLTIKDPNAYSPNDLRSMAFLSNQDVIYRDENGRVSKNQLRHLVRIWKKAPDNKKPKYEFLINGEFKSISEMFEIDYSDYNSIVNLELENGYNQGFSMDHKCVVLDENNKFIMKLSQDIKPGDKFIFSRKGWNINNGIGTYNAGKIVGYYIAEGHFNKKEANRLMFAININRNDIVDEIKEFFASIGCEVKVDTREEVNIHNVTVFGSAAPAFVSQFVRGNKAKEKRLNAILWNTSDDFRKGVYDGYLTTDGCEKAKNFAHTPNKELCQDFIVLASSIGKIFSYKIKKNNYHYFKQDKSDLEYFTSYKLNLRDFEIFDDYYVIPVSNVNIVKTSRTKTVYNFTIDTDKHWVELPNGLISHQCCRLQLDKRALRKRGGGLFGSDSQTGSIGVVTINMARLGYVYKGNMDGLKKRLKELCDMASSTLEKKRKVVEKYNEQGLYPYTRRYINTLDTFFSTIGVNGMNEMVRNFTNDEYDITDSRGQEMCKDLLDFINEQLLRYQEETGTLYNLEATPAEGTTRRLSASDLKRYPDIIQAGYPEAPYYTNSSQLPVDFSTDPFAVLDLQDELQKKYTGGTTLHLYMSERLSTPDAAKQLVKKVFENYRLPYISITPVFSICPKHGYIPGEHAFCPKCDKEIMAAHAEELDFNS